MLQTNLSCSIPQIFWGFFCVASSFFLNNVCLQQENKTLQTMVYWKVFLRAELNSQSDGKEMRSKRRLPDGTRIMCMTKNWIPVWRRWNRCGIADWSLFLNPCFTERHTGTSGEPDHHPLVGYCWVTHTDVLSFLAAWQKRNLLSP